MRVGLLHPFIPSRSRLAFDEDVPEGVPVAAPSRSRIVFD